MSRILIHEPRRKRHEWCRALYDEGHEIVMCTGREALFEALADRRPDVMVYVLGDLALDLGVLWVVRRLAARLPIILLSRAGGLETRRMVQDLRPTYYGVFPLDPTELTQAVHGALSHENGRAIAS